MELVQSVDCSLAMCVCIVAVVARQFASKHGRSDSWVSVNKCIKSRSRPALFGKCLEITFVMIWRYTNKNDLT